MSASGGTRAIVAALAAAGAKADTTLIVSADASAGYQSVVNVMDAARRSGLSRLTFAARTSDSAAR